MRANVGAIYLMSMYFTLNCLIIVQSEETQDSSNLKTANGVAGSGREIH